MDNEESREHETDGHDHVYKFLHWYLLGGDENTPYDFNINPTSDITLRAKYTNTQHNVIKFSTGGIIATPSDQDVPSGGTITPPKDPNNPTSTVPYPIPGSEHPYGGRVYHFDYWYATDSNIPYNFNEPVDDDVIIQIKWTDVTPWTVTFDIGKNYANQTKTVVNGDATTPLLTPSAGTLYEPKDAQGVRTEASRFLHWYLSTDTTESAYDFTTPVTSDITLKGKRNDLPLRTVTFTDTENRFANEDVGTLRVIPGPIQGMIDGETVADPQIIHIGEVIKTTNDPAHPFYKFKGWFKTGETTAYDFTQALTGDLTLNANWEEVIAHKITYASAHLTPSKIREYVQDGQVTSAPTSPVVNQEVNIGNMIYKFNYWYATDSNISFDFSIAIHEDYDLTAKWTGTMMAIPPSPNPKPPGGGGGGGTGGGYIPSIPLETPPIKDPTKPPMPSLPKIEHKTGSTDIEIKKDIEDFIATGDPTVVNTPGVNVDELITLRKLVYSEPDSSEILTEDPRKSWHKISTSIWYYANKDVGLLRGWHHDDQDKQFYYLDSKTGLMAVGWTQIGEHYYYFSENPESDNWYEINGEWTTKNHNDISIGSMYVNRRTPDGYYVDAYGHYVESAGQVSIDELKNHMISQEEFIAQQNLNDKQEKDLSQ